MISQAASLNKAPTPKAKVAAEVKAAWIGFAVNISERLPFIARMRAYRFMLHYLGCYLGTDNTSEGAKFLSRDQRRSSYERPRSSLP